MSAASFFSAGRLLIGNEILPANKTNRRPAVLAGDFTHVNFVLVEQLEQLFEVCANLYNIHV